MGNKVKVLHSLTVLSLLLAWEEPSQDVER